MAPIALHGVCVERESALKPARVHPRSLEPLGKKDALQISKGLRQIIVQDDIPIFAKTADFFFHLLEPATDLFRRIRAPSFKSNSQRIKGRWKNENQDGILKMFFDLERPLHVDFE